MRSELFAHMSHELRTPLNHIIGFTKLVVDKSFGDLNEVQQEYLNDVLDSSRNLLSLINDILELSKMEAGKSKLEISDVNLEIILNDSYSMFKEEALKHGIELRMETVDIPETIKADDRKLMKIMDNLLSNAVKFTPDGGRVSVSAKKINCILRRGLRPENPMSLQTMDNPDSGGKLSGSPVQNCVEISVSDTGIGIEVQYLKRIFNPFDKLQDAGNRKSQGTGLGLSLTKSLVKLHGGAVWAESKGIGKGSTFRFVIPIQDINVNDFIEAPQADKELIESDTNLIC